MAFQVYLAGRIGASGIGLFELISSVNMVAITFATSGIRLAATRLVAEEEGNRNPRGAGRSLRGALSYALLFGVGAMLLLLSLSGMAAEVWIGDKAAEPSLYILAFALPFISLSSALSGYLVARRRAVTVSVIQFSEMLFRMSATVLALGRVPSGDLGSSCEALTLGDTLSEGFAFLLLAAVCLRDRKKEGNRGASVPVLRPLLRITVPLSLSSYARSLLSSMQHLFIPRGLSAFGGSHGEALASYGVIQGMALPILLFPSALVSVLSDLIVPELTEAQVRGHERNLSYMLRRIYRLGLFYSMAAGGLCMAFSEELGVLFFEEAAVGRFIRVLSPLVPAMYMDALVDGMLKGVGEYRANMRYNIIDAGVGLLLVYFLIPRFGVAGYVFSISATELLNFFLSVRRLSTVTAFRMMLMDWIISALSFALAAGSVRLFPGTLFLQMTLTLVLYLVLLFLSGLLKREDLRWFRRLFFAGD